MVSYIMMSSVLILIVILVRAVLKGRIMLRVQYALWLLVLLRLLMPAEFISSPLSIMNAVEFAAASAEKPDNQINVITSADMAVNTITDKVMNAAGSSDRKEGDSGKTEGASNIQNTGTLDVKGKLPVPGGDTVKKGC